MNKLTKIVLLNALLLACATASANMGTSADAATTTADTIEKKARSGLDINFQRVLSAKSLPNENSLSAADALQSSEKSRLFKKLPDHLVAANP